MCTYHYMFVCANAQDVANSACLGAAYLARLGRCRAAAGAGDAASLVTFDTATAAAEPFQLACRPRPDAQQVSSHPRLCSGPVCRSGA